MKGRVVLVDSDTATGLRRAALVVDGRLEALEIDLIDDPTPRPGSVYSAKVTGRIPAMGAAFLDLDGQPGFLPDAGDAKPGDALLVQVRREAEGDKAARVSTDIQIAHRLMVHTPLKPGVSVSRKIADPGERDDLKCALEGFDGYVIRTAAAGTKRTVLAEIAGSLALPRELRPGLIREGPDAMGRLLLEHDTSNATFENTGDPFLHHDIDAQIDALLDPRIPLADGAWMTIESTTALIAIDVNTGSSVSGDAIQRANLAAADALPRQLRLRRLGGAIAIDYAGGPKGKARGRLEARISPSDISVLGWGPAGWLECRRRKPGRSLADIIGASR